MLLCLKVDTVSKEHEIILPSIFIKNRSIVYIKALMTNKIILAYDEGLEEEQIRLQAEKLALNNAVFKNSVGYVFDKDNEILPKGSKASPSDMGKAINTVCTLVMLNI